MLKSQLWLCLMEGRASLTVLVPTVQVFTLTQAVVCFKISVLMLCVPHSPESSCRAVSTSAQCSWNWDFFVT